MTTQQSLNLKARKELKASIDCSKSFGSLQLAHRQGEQGYALIALLALMTIMALLLITAVPNVRRQAQRSLEEEAIWRGEQVAEAIRLYTIVRKTPPTSMEQLLEGVPVGAKKVQVLRPVAARDPLSSTGEWKLIRRTDSALLDFQRAVIAYAGRQVTTRDTAFVTAAGGQPAPIANVLDTGSEEAAPGGEDDTANSTGAFIGVASRSRRSSVITYYGIERHDKWIFTPYFR